MKYYNRCMNSHIFIPFGLRILGAHKSHHHAKAVPHRWGSFQPFFYELDQVTIKYAVLSHMT